MTVSYIFASVSGIRDKGTSSNIKEETRNDWSQYSCDEQRELISMEHRSVTKKDLDRNHPTLTFLVAGL
jgi:hypothetical protein